MKLTVEKTALTNALSAVQGALAKRGTIDALESILITANAGNVTLRATDMELQASAELEATVDADGVALVSGDLIGNIARRAGDTVTLELDGYVMSVKTGRSKFRLPVLPADTFPEFSDFEAVANFTLSADQVEKLTRETAFAISDQASVNAALTGVYLHGGAEGVHAVATNGHVMGVSSVSVPEDFAGVILPAKAVAQLQGMAKREAVIQVRVSERLVSFSGAWETFTTKLIDGSFPPYRQVIPVQNDNVATVDAKALKQAVDRATIVSSDKVRTVRLSFADGALTVSAGREGQEASDQIECEAGAEFSAAYNAKYILGAVSSLASGKVQFLTGDPDRAIIMRPDGDTSATVVMMPMRG